MKFKVLITMSIIAITILTTFQSTASIDTQAMTISAIPPDGNYTVTMYTGSDDKVIREEWSPHGVPSVSIFIASSKARGAGYIHFTMGTSPKGAIQVGNWGKDEKDKLIWQPQANFTTVSAIHTLKFPAFSFDSNGIRIKGEVTTGPHSQSLQCKMGSQSLEIVHGGGGTHTLSFGMSPAQIIGATTSWNFGTLAANWGFPATHSTNWEIFKEVEKDDDVVHCNTETCRIAVKKANEHEKPHKGCGHLYYWCNSNHVREHMQRTCNRMVWRRKRKGHSRYWVRELCKVQYRRCSNGTCGITEKFGNQRYTAHR